MKKKIMTIALMCQMAASSHAQVYGGDTWVQFPTRDLKKLGTVPVIHTRDHLGNNRAVIDESGTVRQKIDYYPSGTPFSTRAYTITSGFQPFKYNGKEFDMMHGLNTYDYGARQYYPLFVQWDRIDPLCEKYYHVSPYAYCLNNPVKFEGSRDGSPDSFT